RRDQGTWAAHPARRGRGGVRQPGTHRRLSAAEADHARPALRGHGHQGHRHARRSRSGTAARHPSGDDRLPAARTLVGLTANQSAEESHPVFALCVEERKRVSIMAPSRIPSRRPRAVLRAVTATAAAALLLSACTGGSGTSGAGDTSGNQLLTIPREDLATFTRNFNPLSPQAAPMTKEAIYEPLVVHSMANAKDTPWLATKWEEAKDGKSLTFTLREGVKWSDGKPLVADDVVYTFELRKKVLGGLEYLDKVTAVDAHTVKFSFNKPFSPGFFEIAGQQIMPKHIWSKVKDPAKFTNPNPVGTGPYTKLEKFQAQSYELRKNPDYWQPDKPQIAGIQMLAFSGNDSANLAFTNGEADWTQSFIPDIEKSFVTKDKKHNHYWNPPAGAMIN